MSNWITILCPTFIHFILSLSLLCLIISSIPSYTHQYSYLFTSPPWTSLSSILCDFYDRIRLLWIECTTDHYHKEWTWLQILFSLALPESEETAFEEQFKYLIVTSTALNDTSAQQTGNSLTTDTIPNSSASTITTYTISHLLPNALTIYYAVIAIVAIFDLVFIGFSCINLVGALCFHWSQPSYSSLLLVQAIFLGILFTAYRKLRFTKIRRTYTRLLQHLRQLLHVTRTCDRLMDQLVTKIHDVETISQGHTLVSANSALENPRSHQSPQTLRMQMTARSTLGPYLKSITSLLQMAMPLTHPVNFATLRGLYNVKELFSPSPLDTVAGGGDDEYDTSSFDYEQLDCLVYMIRSRRREWFLRLLALEMMTLGHDSAQQDYEVLLEIVECMMMDMEQQTELVTQNMKTALASDLYSEPLDYMNDKKIDQCSWTVLNNLALLETHVRNLQTKIVLCRHDANDFSLDKGLDHSFNRMNTRFTNMEQDITTLLDLWDENKHALLNTINEQRKSATDSHLPSPPSSPAFSISKRESIRRSYTTTKTSFASPISSSVYAQIPSSSSTSSARSSPSSSSVSAPEIASMQSNHQLQVANDSHLDNLSRQSWIATDTVASFLKSRRVCRIQSKQKHQGKSAAEFDSLSSSQSLPSDILWSSTSTPSPSPSPCVASLETVGD